MGLLDPPEPTFRKISPCSSVSPWCCRCVSLAHVKKLKHGPFQYLSLITLSVSHYKRMHSTLSISCWPCLSYTLSYIHSKGRSKGNAAGGVYKAIAAGARRRWERGFRRLDAVTCNFGFVTMSGTGSGWSQYNSISGAHRALFNSLRLNTR